MMETRKILTILVLALGLLVCWAEVSEAGPMGTAFTYQGRLTDANNAANGQYDFQFKAYDASTDGNQVGGNISKLEVEVRDGYFTVVLDFNDPNVFNGEARWVEIGARPGEQSDPNVYTTLSPRQQVTAAPYALALPAVRVEQNEVSPNIIGGWKGNYIGPGVVGSVIGGGGSAAEEPNEPGSNDIEDGDYSGIFTGDKNNIYDDYCFIGGGHWNAAGKKDGDPTGQRYAVVAGGKLNTAKGQYATVPGGFDNHANGEFSFAAGRSAATAHEGTFVWADSTTHQLFESTGNHQFLIRATGGVGVGTGNPTGNLEIVGSLADAKVKFGGSGGDAHHLSSARDLVFNSDRTETDAAFYFRSARYDRLNSHTNLVTILGNGNVGIGTITPDYELQVSGDVCPETHKGSDLGKSGLAWDDIYYDDLYNQGAAAFTDRIVTGEILAHPPMAKKPGMFDHMTERGLEELDPYSLPEDLHDDFDLLTDEMTTYNYKANYEQQVQIEKLVGENEALKQRIEGLERTLERLVKGKEF